MQAKDYKKLWLNNRRRGCIVIGCTNNRFRSQCIDTTMFGLPLFDNTQRLRWLKLIGRENLADAPIAEFNFNVCEAHFDPRDILEYDGDGQQHVKQTKILRPGAVPSLQLPIFARIMELTNAVAEPDNPPHLYTRLFHKVCDRILATDLAEIAKAQASLNFIHDEVKKCTAYKQFCLTLFHSSPRAYIMLQKALRLPPSKKIKKLGIPFTSHLNEEMLSTLKMKVNKMSDKEKNCAVVVCKKDLETSLFYNIKIDRIIGFREIDGVQKPVPANHVVVIMAQGILSNWKQLVTFALLSPCDNVDEISKWIDSILMKLFDIGLNVRAVVSDPDNEFIRTPGNKRTRTNDNYFEINGKKIFYFYDISLLTKTVYHYFLEHIFYYEDRHVAKLGDLKQFYELDKSRKVRLAEQLKPEHLDPTKAATLTVQHATEVFSKAVGVGISTCVHFKAISDSGMGTAQFIILMSKLRKTLTKEALLGTDDNLSFLIKVMNIFYSLKLFTPNGEMIDNVKFKEAFQVTIRSTLSLLEDLQAEGHKSITIKNLQHDGFLMIFQKILKNFAKGKMNPTSREFINGFRSFCFSRFENPPTGAYRAQDFRVELLKFAETYEKVNLDELKSKDDILDPRNSFTAVKCADYNKLNVQQNDSLLKICSYLLEICYAKHECQQFKLYLDQNNVRGKAYVVFNNYIMDNPFDFRTVAPDDFVFYIERLEQTFYNAFEETHIKNPIALNIYEQLKNFALQPAPCPCLQFPIKYLQKLFIRLRIYFMIKHNNIGFRDNQEFSV